MSDSLAKHLRRAEREKTRLRRDYAAHKHRLSVANDDVKYYRHKAAMAGTAAGFVETVCATLWLDFINSGISHRKVLAFIREVERG